MVTCITRTSAVRGTDILVLVYYWPNIADGGPTTNTG